jgi:hypothetical protein
MASALILEVRRRDSPSVAKAGDFSRVFTASSQQRYPKMSWLQHILVQVRAGAAGGCS